MHEFDAAEIAHQAAHAVTQAGLIIRDASLRPRQVRHKGPIDLVTETDLAVEQVLKQHLAEVLPGSRFLAEETSPEAALEENTWIIDPLDGTTNFAHGLPFVATSVALWRQGRVEIGIINLPLLGELFVAVRGQGAIMNGKPISVSGVDDLSAALIATGFPYDTKKYLDCILKNIKQMLLKTHGVRRPGAAALDLAFVACGRFDGFYENALNPWDVAAGMLLVEEAGGRVSQFDASLAYVFGCDSILASNGRIHEQMSRVLTDDDRA